MSIRRLGSPTSSPGCQIIPPSASTSFCLGIGGRQHASLTLPDRAASSAASARPRGPHRMLTKLAQSKILFQSVGTTLALRCVTRGVTLALPVVAVVGPRQRDLTVRWWRVGLGLKELNDRSRQSDSKARQLAA